MNKSSFFAFLTIFLLMLLGIKGFYLLQHRPRNGEQSFFSFVMAEDRGKDRAKDIAKDVEDDQPFRHFQPNRFRRAAAPEVDLAIRRQLDAAAAETPTLPTTENSNAAENDFVSVNEQIAAIYSLMPPADSARIIGDMATQQIISLFKLMRPEDASAVLLHLPLEKAREITEQMLEQALGNPLETENMPERIESPS